MGNINDLLGGHVILDVERTDRLCLNGCLASLATGGGLIRFSSSRIWASLFPRPLCWARLAKAGGIPWVHFQHGARKDEVANRMRQQRGVRDQVAFIGVTQEKAQTFSA